VIKYLKKPDGRKRTLFKELDKWFKQIDKLNQKIIDTYEISPFEYNEICAAGLMSNAAALSGYLPFIEYNILKKHKGQRTKKYGRADLWFSSNNYAYSFELKRAWYRATISNLQGQLDFAYKDICKIPSDEYHYAFACVIAHVRDKDINEIYQDFSKTENVDIALRISQKENFETYLYFQLRK